MNRSDKNRTRWREGALAAAALALLLAACLCFCLCRGLCRVNAAPIHAVSAEKLEAALKLDINRADACRIAELPGIGEELAGSIVEYRQLNGPFEHIEDIMDVEGIGEGRFEAMRDVIFAGQFE